MYNALLPRWTAFYQPWVAGFSSNRLKGVFLPVWFILCFLPLEFFLVSCTIAQQLGRVLAKDIPLVAIKEHRFCVAMDVTQGRVSSVGILFIDGKMVEMPLEYNSFHIHCPHYPGLPHGAEKCSGQLPKPSFTDTQQQSGTPPLNKPIPEGSPNSQTSNRNSRPRRKHVKKWSTSKSKCFSIPDAEGWIQVNNRSSRTSKHLSSQSGNQAGLSSSEATYRSQKEFYQCYIPCYHQQNQHKLHYRQEYRSKMVPMEIDPKPTTSLMVVARCTSPLRQ